ncbi:hypothetical protein EMCG_08638 [[Emmonsia] crescens]|uniref:PHD-type domain-containing protein n=1 Tax=[Emmonsia] crescens TaxID=73230 RepID=A0A0G2I4J0_9EURO|nr:hypothetical protein EMCG_08638 [Emmonsia crescens UAMH 3008]
MCMNSFNYSNGEPQTPKRTPTSAAFGESAFHTPKLESSFYDPRVTWNTADPYASSPEFLKTPQRLGLTTPSNHNYLHGLAERDSTTLDPSASFALSLSPQLERTSLSGTVRGSKTKGSTKKGSNRSGKKAAGDQGNNDGDGDGDRDTIDSAKRSAASMQTPPPTSTGRRKMQDRSNLGNTHPGEAGNNNHNHNNTMGPPDSSHLETPSRVVGISANLFEGQSPNLFEVAAGVSSADSPFFPQNRLFWGQDTQFPTGSLDMSDNYGDPFGPNQTTAFDAFDQGQMQHNTLQVPQFHTMQAPPGMGHFSDPHAYHTTPSMGPIDSNTLYPTSFSTSPRLPTVRDEDPAMFLSSPARRFGFSEPTLPQDTPPRLETRQPYHHQTEESKREKRLKELKRAKSLARRKAEAADEAADALRQSRSSQLLSRQSSTHSTHPHSRHASAHSSSGPGSSGSGVRKTPAKGRLSPLKTQAPSFPRPSSSAAALPGPVESVVLKIGKDGRAKTEMKVVAESPAAFGRGPGMDVDDSSTESETESSDESDFPISHSTNPSFNIHPDATPRQRNISRAHSTSRPHSKSSSYSSTVTSPHSGRHSPWTSSSRGSGKLPQQLPTQQEVWMSARNRHATNPPGGHSRGQSITDSEATQDDDDTGDAQHALKQVLKGRHRPARQPAPPTYSQKTRSSHALGILRSSPPGFGGRFDSRRGEISSPTTMTDPDFATPTTERQSNPSNGTRCVCNSMDNGGHLMIQCESCTHWLHTKCVGLDRQSLPPVYICIYCTQTPMRGGRIRDPLVGGVGGQIPTSPLAHKSYRFR